MDPTGHRPHLEGYQLIGNNFVYNPAGFLKPFFKGHRSLKRKKHDIEGLINSSCNLIELSDKLSSLVLRIFR